MPTRLPASALLLACAACLCPAAAAAGADSGAARVALRWKPVPGATAYDVQISITRDFATLLVEQRVKVVGYRWSEIAPSAYFWRVRSIDTDGRAGAWSEPNVIEPALVPLRLEAPADGAAIVFEEDTAAVQLSVEPSKLVREYVFELSTDRRFGGQSDIARSPKPTARLALPGTGTFYWRAQAQSISGKELPAGEVRRLTVTLGASRPVAPAADAVLLEPGASAGNLAVELSWTSPRAAVRHRIQLTRDGVPLPVTETPYSSVRLSTAGPGRYGVSIKGVDSAGREAPASAERSFTVELAPPELLSPEEAASFRTRTAPPPVDLRWAANRFAESFVLEVARDAAFSQPVATPAAPVAGARFEVAGLAPGRYHWRVAARSRDGTGSKPSPARSFEVLPPVQLVAPAILAPTGPVVDRDDTPPRLRIAWSKVAGAAGYEITGAGDGAALGVTRLPSATSELQAEGLAAGPRVIQVRGVDEDGIPGPWSAPLHFFYGRPVSARAEIRVVKSSLITDGAAHTEVEIRLFDAEGRRIRGAPLEAGSSTGGVGAVRHADEAYQVRFVAPETTPAEGFAELTVRDRGFSASTRIGLREPPGALRVGPRLGFRHNLASSAGAFVGAEAMLRTPLLRRKLLVSLRGGFYGTSVTVPSGAAATGASARVFPLALVALVEHSLAELGVYGGAGPTLELARIKVGEESAGTAAVGLQALGGASRRVGPGEIFGEAALAFGSFDTPLARLESGGLLLSVGYRFEL